MKNYSRSGDSRFWGARRTAVLQEEAFQEVLKAPAAAQMSVGRWQNTWATTYSRSREGVIQKYQRLHTLSHNGCTPSQQRVFCFWMESHKIMWSQEVKKFPKWKMYKMNLKDLVTSQMLRVHVLDTVPTVFFTHVYFSFIYYVFVLLIWEKHERKCGIKLWHHK